MGHRLNTPGPVRNPAASCAAKAKIGIQNRKINPSNIVKAGVAVAPDAKAGRACASSRRGNQTFFRQATGVRDLKRKATVGLLGLLSCGINSLQMHSSVGIFKTNASTPSLFSFRPFVPA